MYYSPDATVMTWLILFRGQSLPGLPVHCGYSSTSLHRCSLPHYRCSGRSILLMQSRS